MNLEWMAIRGSGLVAYLLLAAVTIWGLLVATKALGPRQAKSTTWFHESLAVGAIIATAVHMVALYLDEFVEFGPKELFIPGASTWKPLPVTFGVMAFYALLLITASFYVRKYIGQSRWRALHYTSFGAFIVALAHGVLAGTDSAHPVVFGIYVATGAMVVLLVVIRFAQSSPQPRPRPTPKAKVEPDRSASAESVEPAEA